MDVSVIGRLNTSISLIIFHYNRSCSFAKYLLDFKVCIVWTVKLFSFVVQCGQLS